MALNNKKYHFCSRKFFDKHRLFLREITLSPCILLYHKCAISDRQQSLSSPRGIRHPSWVSDTLATAIQLNILLLPFFLLSKE